MGERWVLAIDFGTSFTSAAMVVNERVEVLEIDGVRRLPSVVLWLDDELVVGAAAETQRVLHPQAAERNPKRYLGVRKNLLLGGHPVPVVDAAGAVLGAVYEEALRRSGGQPPSDVRLTHPARWPAERLDALRAAADTAGIPAVSLLAEPVAAAMHYGGTRISTGDYVAVYDLGGGTFDTAVLRRVEHGFELAGPPGGDDRLGGEDFDHRLMDFVIARLAVTEPDAAIALRESDELQWRKAASQVLVEARLAKEALSRQTSYTLLLPPPVNQEMRITRPEFEALIRADVQRTIDEFSATIEAAELDPSQLSARYLAGGSSRIPLVSRLLQEAFDAAPDTYDDPKVAVALGAAQAADPRSVTVVSTNGNGASTPTVVDDPTGVDVLAGAVATAALVEPAMKTSPPPPPPTAPPPPVAPATVKPAPPLPAPPDDTVELPVPPTVVAPVLTSASVVPDHDAADATEGGKRRSDPRTRRMALILGVGLFVLAILTVVLIARASSDKDPGPTAQLSFPSQDLGFAALERTWTVEDGSLEGVLTFANSGTEQSTGRHNEVFPKSMVTSADQVSSDPVATQIVRPDPILGYDLVIPAGGTATITYHVKVAPETDDAALARWRDEAQTELATYQSDSTKKPALVLAEPADQAEVGVSEVLFRGNTDPGAKIDINGTVIPVNTDGSFSHLSTEMAEGPTTFVVTATGANGQISQVTLTVTYVSPAPAPAEIASGAPAPAPAANNSPVTQTQTDGSDTNTSPVEKPTVWITGDTYGYVGGSSFYIQGHATGATNTYWVAETLEHDYMYSYGEYLELYCPSAGSWTHYYYAGNSAGENYATYTVTCY